MITIKLPIYLSDSDKLFINDLRRKQSSIIRSSYNRFKDGLSQLDTEHIIKPLFNIDSWFLRCGVLEGKQIFNRFRDKKVIFGSKSNFYNYIKGKITKDEYKSHRLLPLNIQGEQDKNGNRKFTLDIIDNNTIIFKANRKNHINISLPKIRKNYLNKLYQLQLSKNKYSIKLTDEYICISFEEQIKKEIHLIENRCIGIDQNPSEIGISILEFDANNNYKILKTYSINMKKLLIKSNVSSDNDKSKYLQNKLKYETVQIADVISNISKHWHCKYIFIESLSFNKPFNSKELNRICKQKWLRTLFIEQLNKRLVISNQKMLEINPAYTSLIGNLQNDYIDCVNSSIEICRRGYEIRVKRNKNFYPIIKIKDTFQHQWKEKGDVRLNSWKEMMEEIKTLRIRYRVSLEEVSTKYSVLRIRSIKSKLYLYNFE